MTYASESAMLHLHNTFSFLKNGFCKFKFCNMEYIETE